MASYNELLALIDAYINQNGVQAITGQVLNGVLRAMVDQLGRGYSIMGAADPTTDPGTPDGPETWFASVPGTYTNFDGIQIVPGELALLSYVPSDGFSKNTIYEGFQTVQATIDGNVGTPAVGVSYANGILSFDFHNMKGNPGNDGAPAGFGTVNATVDDQVGTPSVSVSSSGPDTAKNFTFAFRNLKGETGVTSVLATVDNTSGNPQCAVSLNGQQLVLNFTGLKGAQGDTGSSVDYPFTIVNNLTTNDPAQALSAAMGVQLESEVSQLEAKVTDLENEIYAVNLVDSSFFTGTFYWFENGVVKTISNSTSRYVSGLIHVFEKEKIKFKSRVGTTYLSLVAFDSTKTPIESKSVVGINNWLEDTYIVPSGVSYIQVQNYSISSYPGCYVQTKGMANDISERAVEYDELTLVRFVNLASREDILNDTTVNYQGNVVSSSGRHCLKLDISSYPVGQFFTIYGFNLGSGMGYYALYNGGTKISFASFNATSENVSPLFVEKPNGATHLYVSIDSASSPEGGYNGLVACLGKGLVGQVPMMKYVKTISDYGLDALNKTEIVSVIGKNIANKDNIGTIGVNSNGVVSSSTNNYKSVRINVSEYDAGTKVTFGGFFLGQSGNYSFTDASNSPITYGVFADPNGVANPVTVEVPQGAVLLTFPVLSPNSPSNPYEELMANVGEELLPYEEYQQVIKKIGKYTFAGGAEDSRVPALVAEIGEMQGEIADLQDLGGIIVDLPVSDGSDISVGYAYINSSTGAVIVKQ